MKKYIFILLMFSCFNLQAQKAERIKQAGSMTWYGIDFSYAKMVGADTDFSNPEKIVSYYFNEFNDLFLAEPFKYNIKSAFNNMLEADLEIVKQRNLQIDPYNLIASTPHTLSMDEINEVVRHYPGAESLGVIFIVESFNKHIPEVTFWSVIFDVNTHEVLVAKQVTGKAGGIGFRNFWAGGFYKGIKYINTHYQGWLKEMDKQEKI